MPTHRGKRCVKVYNLGGTELLHKVTARKAQSMVRRGVAREYDVRVRGEELVLESIELIDWTDTTRMYDTPDDEHVSHALIRIRDKFTCGYCLGYGDTVDHIMPASRGGPNTWTNLVTACRDCNGSKADMTPEEAGMTLRLPAYAPADERAWKLERAFGQH